MATPAARPIQSGESTNHFLAKLLNALAIAGAFATVPLIVLLEQPVVPVWAAVADWIVWSIFVFEYVVTLFASRARLVYVKSNRVGLAVIVLSFPSLPAMLAIVRIARLARFLRLLRLAGSTARAVHGLGAILGRKGFVYVASGSLFIVVGGGAALAVL